VYTLKNSCQSGPYLDYLHSLGAAQLIAKLFSSFNGCCVLKASDDDTADRVIKLLRSTYADFGPTLSGCSLGSP
jgi:hypothetical protein